MSHALCFMGHWHIMARGESSIMCLSSCSIIRAALSHLQFRHLLLLITVFLHLFFHLSFCFCSLPFPLVSHPHSSLRLSFCVHVKGRQGLWRPLKLDRVCVCPGVCQAKEQGVICGFTSTALNCIK